MRWECIVSDLECIGVRDRSSTVSVHIKSDISQTLLTVRNNKEIDRKCLAYLLPGNPRPGCFYLLPKIHKGALPSPGCPIVSAIGSPTEKISEFLDFLQPTLSSIHTTEPGTILQGYSFSNLRCCLTLYQHPIDRERERLSLSAFFRTEDIGVHIVHISRLIIT